MLDFLQESDYETLNEHLLRIHSDGLSLEDNSDSSRDRLFNLLYSSVREGTLPLYLEATRLSVRQQTVKMDPVRSSDLNSPNVFTVDPGVSKISIGAVVPVWPGGTWKHQKLILVPEKHQAQPGKVLAPPHKILAWDRRGVAEARFAAAIRDLVECHDPSAAVIFNTRTRGEEAVEELIRELGFSRSYRVEPSGFLGGLWLLWHEEDASVQVSLLSNSHLILAEVRFLQ